MRVYMGPYYHWFQPYKWAKDCILWWYGFHDGSNAKKFDMEQYDALNACIRKRLSWLDKLEQWIDNRHKRKIYVRVDNYDIWGADDTLGRIILPTLKLLREKKRGAPHTDDADVPEQLRSTAAPALTEKQVNMGSPDENWHLRWAWIINEMIWAMQQVVDDDESQFFTHSNERESSDSPFNKSYFDKDGLEKWQTRKQHGLMLFGKYFEALWN